MICVLIRGNIPATGMERSEGSERRVSEGRGEGGGGLYRRQLEGPVIMLLLLISLIDVSAQLIR